MPRPASPFREIDFLSLSDEVPVQLRPGTAQVLQNLYRNRRGLRTRLGTAPLWPSGLGAFPLDGLAAFRIDSLDRLLSAYQGSIYHWLTGVGPVLMLNATTKLTANLPVSFAWLAGAVYAGDGTRPNVRITSTRVDQALPTAPSTAPTAADGGAGSMSAGDYAYKVTFLSAAGVETDPGPASNTLTLAGSRQVDLTGIPVGTAGEDVSGRKLYRTSDTGTTYLYVATISDNTTTTYTDNSVSLIGNDPIPEGRDRLPPCNKIIEHHHRLYAAGCLTADGDERTVYISNFGEGEISPAAPDLEIVTQGTRIPLSGSVDGRITALASHGDKVWVWTSAHMFALTGDLALDFSLQPFAAIGCTAHRTCCSLKDALYWLAADGVYRAQEGGGIERISTPIQDFIDALSAEDLADAAAVCWDNRYYLLTPQGTRVWDTEYGTWSENTPWPFAIGTVGGLGAEKPRLFGAHNEEGMVWELETGTLDDTDRILCHWASADMDFGLPGREKRLHYLGAVWKVAEGEATVSLTKGTGGVIESIVQDLSETPEENGLVSRLYQRVTAEARSEWFAISIQASGVEGYQLLSADGLWTFAK